MTVYCRLAYCLFFFLALQGVMAQQPHWRQEELALGFEVKWMQLDASGFIWAASEKQLYRFDGIRWDAFSHPVDSSDISMLRCWGQDEVWLGYENGQLAYLEKGSFRLFEPEEGMPQVAITGLARDAQGHLWFSTYGEGLYMYNGRHLYQRGMEDGLPNEDLYCLVADASGNLFAGSDRGLVEVKSRGKDAQIQVIKTLPDLIVKSLAIGQNQQVWIGMYEGGIAAYDPQTGQVELPMAADWELGEVAQLLELAGQLLIGTARRGLWMWDGHSLQAWLTSRRERIDAMLTDGQGQLFVHSKQQGFQSASYRFQRFPRVNTKVQAVYEASDGSLYFATENGFFCRDLAGEIDSILYPTQLNIICLSENVQGEILLGTFGEGMLIYNSATRQKRPFTEKEGLINDNVIAFAQQKSSIWIATLGGAMRCRWQDGRLIEKEYVRQEDGLGTNYLYHVFVDQADRVWLGTDGHGVYCLGGDGWEQLSFLTSQNIYSITQDAQGHMYVASDSLFQWKNEKLAALQLPALAAIQPAAVVCDAQQRLLIPHQEGITIVDRSRRAAVQMGVETGLGAFEADLNVLAKGKGGRIWLGSPKGLFCYQAAIPLSYEAHIRLKGVRIFQDSLEQDPMALSYDQDNISFDFTGIFYQNPDVVRYKYRLLGLDETWQQTKDERITFPKLSAGSYQFEVAALHPHSNDVGEQETFAFRIHLPFWQRWWFILLASLGLLAVLWALWQAREKRLRKQEMIEQERIRFQFETLRSQVNPHFLFNSFNTLMNLIDEAPQLAVSYVEKLSDLFRNMLAFRDKDSITLREELSLLADYLFLQKQRYGENLQLKLEVDEQKYTQHIVPLSLQMLVENAIKHNIISKASPLPVHIFVENDMIIVRNPLQRKRTAPPSTRLGLHNIQRRYELLSEKAVEIQQTETHFSVSIPLLNPE